MKWETFSWCQTIFCFIHVDTVNKAFYKLFHKFNVFHFLFIYFSERPWLVDAYNQWIERLKVRNLVYPQFRVWDLHWSLRDWCSFQLRIVQAALNFFFFPLANQVTSEKKKQRAGEKMSLGSYYVLNSKNKKNSLPVFLMQLKITNCPFMGLMWCDVMSQFYCGWISSALLLLINLI